MKGKIHMNISTNAGIAFDSIQHPFMIKILDKVRRERNYLNIKAVYEKPTAKYSVVKE